MSKLVTLSPRPAPSVAARAARPLRASRYTHVVPLSDGSALAWNALGGSLARWDPDRLAAFRALGAGESRDAEPVAGFVDQLTRNRHLCDAGANETELVRSLYDRERYGDPVLTLSAFPRGPASAPAREPMNASVRAAVAALAIRMAPSLTAIQVRFAGHEPLSAPLAAFDLSLRLAEVAASNRLRYLALVQSDGLSPPPDLLRKLPDVEIRHLEVRLRAPAADSPNLQSTNRLIENLRAASCEPRLSVHLRLDASPDSMNVALHLLDHLARSLSNLRRFDFALGDSVFKSCHRPNESLLSSEQEMTLLGHAQRLGFPIGDTLPRFLSQCQAVKPLSFAIAPDGSLHKCWSTVSQSELRLGNACEPQSLVLPSPHRQRWTTWDPFSDPVCGACSILPLCAGHCADLFPMEPTSSGGERPCPDVKHHLAERLFAAAQMAGILDPERDSHVQPAR